MKMDITVKKPTDQELVSLGVDSWDIWEKEESEFDWDYDVNETCYILEGKGKVICDGIEDVNFEKGDLVTFPRGLSCRWFITERIRKRYRFS